MKSPFPGMDPYLEKRWSGVHARLIIYFGDRLNDQLPPDLEARVETSLYVDAEDTIRTVRSDVDVAEIVQTGSRGGVATIVDVDVAEPSIVMLEPEPAVDRHLEILDLNNGGRVVTVIELLSPTNKVGEGRSKYLAKRDEYLESGVQLVEIDLLRQGTPTIIEPQNLKPSLRTPYVVCIHRRGFVEVYCLPLRNPLPNLRIPLRPTDKDAVLQLQPILDDCYRNGRYSSLDYSVPPEPPFSAEDAAWAGSLISSKHSE